MTIPYKIIRSRRRSICITVKDDKEVIVRAPYRVSLKSIERFVDVKAEWIAKHLEIQERRVKLVNKESYSLGETLLFMGQPFRLQVEGGKRNSVCLNNDVKTITIYHNEKRKMSTAKVLNDWYKREATDYLTEVMSELLKRDTLSHLVPSKVVVKTLKSLWGSCSYHGVITLNSQLVKIDKIFAEYVIIHELCHLKHHNHGSEFYKLLATLCPGYEAIRKELRRYNIR